MMFTAGCCILCLSTRKWFINKARAIVMDIIVYRAAREL